MKTKAIFIFSYCLMFVAMSQCPTSSFMLSNESSVCIDALTDIENTSTDAISHEWDFCSGDLSSETLSGSASLTSSDLGSTFDIELIEDAGTWFGFASSRSRDAIIRLNYGDQLSAMPTIDILPDAEGLLNNPNGFTAYQYDGTWFGYAVNFSNESLVAYNFGNSLANEPVVAEILDASLYGSNNDIVTARDLDSMFVFIPAENAGQIVRHKFLVTDPSNFLIDTLVLSGYSTIASIELIRDCDNWSGIVTSFGDSKVSKLVFGTSLSNEPIVSDISGSFPSAGRVDLVVDGANYYGFIQLRGGSLVRLDFGESMANTPEVTNLGNLGILPSNSFAFSMGKDSSQWTGYGIGFSNNTLYQISFTDECSASIAESTALEPSRVSYGTSGRKYIELKATDEDGHVDYYLDSVDVSTDTAPSISFSVSTSRCITNANTFIPSILGLTTYSWDFDGDGMEDSNAESPQVLFDTLGGAGTYTVRLDVNDGSCDNFYEEEITIYPNPPSPTFNVTTSTTFCTNNELTLTNTTDETGYDDVLTYQWVIGGDVVDQKDTVYTFTDPGVKTITLQSFVPGCSSTITSQDISIDEGPEVDFNYTNNCFGEAIQFSSEVIGENITDYSWDFGDGAGTSSQADTVYQYATAGTYTVQLTVGNVAGCETIYSEDITVNDGVLADFTFDEAIENLPVQFSGVDQTLSNDSIVDWNWDFDGLGSSSSQNTTFTFSEGSYTVSLSTTTAQGCGYQLEKDIDVLASECPSSSFEGASDLCLEETFVLKNLSVNADTYEWDFCIGELNSTPSALTLQNNAGFNTAFDIEIVRSDNSWYGFIPSRNGLGSVLKLNYEDNLRANPTVASLANSLGISGHNGFSVYEYNDLWHGLLVNIVDGRLVRYSFGNSLSNDPTEELLEDLGLYEGNNDITSAVDGDSVYVFVPADNAASIVRLSYNGSSPSIIKTDTLSIAGFSEATDMQLIRECDSWYGLVTSFSDSKVSTLSFGTSLSSTPIVTAISGSFPSATKAELVVEGGDYYGFVQLRGGDLIRLNFGSSLVNIPEVDNLGNLGALSSNSFAFSMGKDSSKWTGYGIGFSNNTLYQISFPDDCGTSLSESTEFEPQEVNYNTPGKKYISLKATNASGHVNYYLDSVEVSSDLAPNASFSIDDSRCITNPNTFTPSILGLTSYSWDFNNDGIEDSNAESPQVLFDTLGGAGTYTVRLDVSDGSCDNFYEEEITIYNPPPVPSYDVSAARYCIGADIAFSNTTDDASYTGPLTYSWEFIDDATSTTVGTSNESNPSFAFTSSGTKTVILTSSIPGCNEITQQTITINPSPTADFSATSVCQNESMQFTNSSVNADTFFWDFGDGFTSTTDDPNHIFTAAGNYSVSLTATDSNGCDNTIINEVSVSATPVPNFDFDIPCTSSDGIQFFDMSTVENADIVSWTWEVDGAEVSSEQNPTILFDSEGIKTIGLTTVSSNGCESFYTEDIEILAAPQPDFQAQIGCQGEVSSFSDNTSFSGNIISYVWTIDGVDYNTESVDHIFENPGIYDVSLEVTGQNFCTESITRQIEVLQLPAVDFDVSGTCDNEILEAYDLSQAFNDAIVSRTWLLDGEVVGNGSELFLNSLESGTYTLTLELQTETGCMTNYSEPLEVNNAPTASFTASKNHGLPNDRINFINSSAGAVDYQWLLNGSQFGTSSDTESITFTEVGTHVVSLVAQNSLGCIDTTNQEILIAIPEVDLAIGDLELVAEDNTGRIFLEVQNFSNLPIEITKAEISLEDQFKITEEIEQFVEIGETRLVSLNIGVPLTNSEPGYLCVNLVSEYVGYPDINPLDNEKCINIQPVIKVENPFPNPVTDRFRLKVVAPNGGDATLRLINSAGKIQIQKTYNATAGLNNFFVEMSTLDPGIYYVTIDISGTIFKRKVIKL